MIRVLVVDDHAILRRGLGQIIEEAGDMRVAAEAESGALAVKLARELELDVVLLDITLPDRTGLDTLKQLRKEKPRLPVLMLSMHPEETYGLRSIKAGASGYLNKQSAPLQLVSAIRQVAKGRRYISPELAEMLAGTVVDGAAETPHEALSNREYETMRGLASGKTVSELAAEMHLSVKTVSVYRTRVLEKMKLKNNAQLTTYAVRNGLVD